MTSAANQVRVSRALSRALCSVFGGGCGAEPRAGRASHVPHADDTRDAVHDMQVLLSRTHICRAAGSVGLVPKAPTDGIDKSRCNHNILWSEKGDTPT